MKSTSARGAKIKIPLDTTATHLADGLIFNKPMPETSKRTGSSA
jgi:hypothetical protein